MSKPSDIPKDVWDEADRALTIAWDAHHAIFNPLSNSISTGLWDRSVEAIARAIMAAKAEEREACAEVADESGINPFNGPAHDVVSKEIAVSIRKREEG